MIIEFYMPDSGVNDAIVIFIRDEIMKLHKQYKNISRADISFSQKNRRSGLERICEISLFISGNTVTAKAICKNFDHACRKAVTTLNENVLLSLRQKVHAL